MPPDVVESVVSALGAVEPRAAAIAAMGMLANGTYDAPDVAGDVNLLISGAPVQRQQLATVEDSYAPSWSQPASFSGVPLDDRLSLAVHFVDRDLSQDDEIGVAMVTMADVRDALAKGGAIHQVPVHRQQPQILLVGIAVFRE